MSRSTELFNGHAFRKSLPNESRKSPINKSLFEVWGNVLSELSEIDYVKLKTNKISFIEKYTNLIHQDDDFNNAISRHSSSQKGVIESDRKIRKMVFDIIQGE
jgi:hypothetical protein